MLLLLVLLAAFVTSASAQTGGYSCDRLDYCTRVETCHQAVFQLLQCGDKARDGDNDRIPCENICGETPSEMQQTLERERSIEPGRFDGIEGPGG